MRSIAVLLCVLPLTAGAAGRGAARSTEASRAANISSWVHEAERLYIAGRYREAAQLLLKAEAAQHDPRFVYNIARAYDQAGDGNAALTYYQRYIASAEGTDPLLLKRSALAVERIRGVQDRESNRRSDAERAQLRKEADVSAESAKKAQASNQAMLDEREQAVQATQLRGADPSRGIALGLGGLAVAAAGGGIVFAVQANRAKAAFGQASTVEDKQKLQATTQLRAGVADACFGVALAAAVTAVIVFPKGAPASERAVSLTPVLGGGFSGLMAGGRF